MTQKETGDAGAGGGVPDEALTEMIADYMETGFLDNIMEMLRQDKTLIPVIPRLVADERSRVRLGAAALVESLKDEEPAMLVDLIPAIASALEHDLPNVRGDAAYILGIIGHQDAIPFLRDVLEGQTGPVHQLISETIDELTPAS